MSEYPLQRVLADVSPGEREQIIAELVAGWSESRIADAHRLSVGQVMRVRIEKNGAPK